MELTPLDDRNWQPATFRERGVAVPFTSPSLAGARVRAAERWCELLVPHPGGARGIYIFALASLAEFCVPTLHDRQLADRLPNLRPFTPAAVRHAARLVAAGGSAGRAAASAAAACLAAEAAAKSRFEGVLLHALIRQDGRDASLAPEQRTAEAVRQLAGRTGRDAEAVRADIGLLSGVVAASGLDLVGGAGAARTGRAHLLLGAISRMQAGLLSSSGAIGADEPGRALADVAMAMRSCGELLLAAAQRVLDDPAGLLTAWAANPGLVTARLCRPDWLLDGWETLCLLWQVAETDDQRARAVAEIAALLPPLPPEADGWFGQPDLSALLRARHAACSPSGRTDAARPSEIVTPAARNETMLVARNEHLRSLAA